MRKKRAVKNSHQQLKLSQKLAALKTALLYPSALSFIHIKRGMVKRKRAFLPVLEKFSDLFSQLLEAVFVNSRLDSSNLQDNSLRLVQEIADRDLEGIMDVTMDLVEDLPIQEVVETLVDFTAENLLV